MSEKPKARIWLTRDNDDDEGAHLWVGTHPPKLSKKGLCWQSTGESIYYKLYGEGMDFGIAPGCIIELLPRLWVGTHPPKL